MRKQNLSLNIGTREKRCFTIQIPLAIFLEVFLSPLDSPDFGKPFVLLRKLISKLNRSLYKIL